MPTRSLVLLAVSALIAFGTAFMVRGYIAGNKTTESGTKVLVASSDIPQGSFIHAGKHFIWASWPESNFNESFVIQGKVDPESFNGAVARRQIMKGEPIMASSLVKSNEGGFMSAVLDPGMRAVSIAVDPTTGNAGFIFPGDRVDLIVTHSIHTQVGDESKSEEVLASETFIENVRVLAVDQTVDNPDKTAILAKTVTLEVSRQQAEKINVAKDLGKISLSLRSLATEKDSEQTAAAADQPSYTRDSDVSKILGPRSSAVFRVQVIRGGEREQVEFNRN